MVFCGDMAPKAKKAASAAAKEALAKKAKEQALQAVRENVAFKGFSSSQIHSTIIGGHSLLQRVTADKLLALQGKAGGPSFGSNYFRGLAAQYRGGGESQVVSLRPVHVGGAARELLVEALIMMDKKPQEPGPLLEFMACDEEAVGYKEYTQNTRQHKTRQDCNSILALWAIDTGLSC